MDILTITYDVMDGDDILYHVEANISGAKLKLLYRDIIRKNYLGSVAESTDKSKDIYDYAVAIFGQLSQEFRRRYSVQEIYLLGVKVSSGNTTICIQ